MSDVNPAAPSWITADGQFGSVDTAPEEVRDVIKQKGWKDVPSAIKSYKELESHLGKLKGQPNIPDVIPDDLIPTLYQKLGKPESPDKYEFKAAEGVALDDALLGKFKQYAHGLNLTNKQFNDVVSFQVQAMTEAMTAQEQAQQAGFEQAAKALQDEWKENYEANFKQAKTAAEKLGVLEDLEQLGLANNPSAIKMLHKLSAQLSEDTIMPKNPSSAIDPKQELSELMKSDALKNRLHPDHKKAHQRFLELHGVLRG